MSIPKISVIVPVYNVEKYLRRCIESILSQTFDDFELLLIDDGSTDLSGSVCDEYARMDDRIHVFHKPNGGVSSARNIGLDKFDGEWICFIDSDDKIEKDFLECIIKEKNNAEFIVTGYTQKYEDHNEIVKYKEQLIYCDRGLSQTLNYYPDYILCIFYHPWRKLYKGSIINNNKLRFDENIFYGEDTSFILKYLCYVNTIEITSCTSYIYSSPISGEKYLMNLNELEYHISLFDFNLLKLEQIKSLQLHGLRELIYTAYFNKFITYALSLSMNNAIHEMMKYRQSWVKKRFCTIKCVDKKLRKKVLFLLVYHFPLIYFILKKIKNIYETSCNIRTIPR